MRASERATRAFAREQGLDADHMLSAPRFNRNRATIHNCTVYINRRFDDSWCVDTETDQAMREASKIKSARKPPINMLKGRQLTLNYEARKPVTFEEAQQAIVEGLPVKVAGVTFDESKLHNAHLSDVVFTLLKAERSRLFEEFKDKYLPKWLETNT